MSFCTVCGRERATATGFCTGCGGEFGDSARHGMTLVSPRPPGYHPPPPLPRRTPPPLPDNGTPRPTAGYRAHDDAASMPSSGSRDPDGPYLVRPRQEPVSPRDPDSFSAFFATVDSYRGALPAAGIPRSGGRAPRARNRVVIVAALAVVVLGAAGGAFALSGGHGPGQAGARAGARAGDQLTGRASTGATPSAAGRRTPASPAPASATPSAGHGTGRGGATVVAVAAGVASNPAAPQVTALVDHYFTAINTRDYAAYARLLDRRRRRHETASSFRAGYASTTDSDATLTGILATGSGGVAASVTFTSHQKPANGQDHSSCTRWAITLYLARHGTGYLIETPPSGYRASYQAC
ncbi:MAG: hypothetical protein ACRDPY_24550 [Streptosporangiaceae bacterium]